jgi:hypothetical protein
MAWNSRPRSRGTATHDAWNTHARPSVTAAARGCPRAKAAAARPAAERRTWRDPSPNTRRRISSRRSRESSRPIMNSSMTTPRSAIGPIAAASVIAMASSQGSRSTRAPRPDGPTAMPTSRKPRTGLTRSRWTSGTTTPAAPRMIRASLKSDGVTGLAMAGGYSAAAIAACTFSRLIDGEDGRVPRRSRPVTHEPRRSPQVRQDPRIVFEKSDWSRGRDSNREPRPRAQTQLFP